MDALRLLLTVAVLVAVAAAGPATTSGPALGATKDTTKCIQAQVIYRHGARTIITPSYPTDPNQDPKLYAPFGIGHLTTLGRQMEYELGQLLRARYVGQAATVANLLDEEYSTGILTIKTSYVPRTQESAASSLAGMWPPGQRQKWHTNNSQLGRVWNPIVYETIPQSEDRAIAGTTPCAARDLEYNRVVTSDEYKTRLLRVLGAGAGTAKGQDNLRYLENNSGWTYNFSDPSYATFPYTIFSSTQCQELLGLATPAWIKRVYPEPLRSAAALYLETLSYTPKLIRQTFGDLTTWILNASRNHETQPKFQAYSGHDGTVTAVIQAFELEPLDDAGFGMPEFSACIMIELHQNSWGELGLRFFYRREWGGKVVTMIPRGCSEFCLLEDVAEIVSNKMWQADESCDVPADHGATLREVHLAHVRGADLPAGPARPDSGRDATEAERAPITPA